MLAHDELSKDSFHEFPGKPGKGKVDLHLGRLEKPQGDGDVNSIELSIQRLY